ncbi:hypothetical protein J437_LFUL019566 [Ladona fulva]|nr:hypothetical protein J437_LFUL019566 [Ladona fulva]
MGNPLATNETIDLKNINCSPKGFYFSAPEDFAVAYSDDMKNSINSDIEEVHKKHSISTSSDDGNIFHMSCTSQEVQCMVLECIIGPLRKKEGGVMEFPMKIYPEEWTEILQNYESIRISSIGSLEILDSPEPRQPEISK